MNKVILVIRDGRGYRKDCNENAICETPTPNTTELMKKYPNTLIKTCGEAVGLPEGYQGNSEVGHMTIGSGRIIFQSLVRINKAITDGTFFSNEAFLGAITNAKKNNTALHLIGLLQVEGVHAHQDHLFALLDLCKEEDLSNVYIHIITDGRDSPVTDSEKHIKELKDKLKEIGIGTIATISGRFYTMDRDKRRERTKKAYDCIVNGESEATFNEAEEKIKACHSKEEFDEFIVPTKQEAYKGIKDNDSIIFFNFRTDRTRQLTQAIVEDTFEGRERKPLQVYFTAMTEFYQTKKIHIAFPDQSLDNLLGEVVSKHGLQQLRISETEKYAHVTFFFNGQKEEPNPGEDRILVPSPKVTTYDLKPEMSAYEVTDELTKQIKTEKYNLIVVNIVNGDMVGHTGIPEAIHKAVKTVDDCVGKITTTGLEHDYTLLIFADHGNAEDQTKERRTSHTMNNVPLIVVGKQGYKIKDGGSLEDIAPTTLHIMGLPIPKEMTGKVLVEA